MLNDDIAMKYVQLIIEETHTIASGVSDAFKSEGYLNLLNIHMDILSRNFETLNDLLYKTSTVENSAAYMKFLKAISNFQEYMSSLLRKKSFTEENWQELQHLCYLISFNRPEPHPIP